ncbi:MAG: phage major capsid protein [Propionibacteriaceae bacterium]|nr:phage major capsid protein [Propionibacteriaceae bacterium]
MAITTATMRSDFSDFLPPEEAAPIFDEAARQSAFQRLIPRVPLGINGQAIPVVTSKPTANWVAEGGKKPATNMGLGLLTIKPEKLAAITVMSAEVVRANPGNITGKIREALAGAFATAFDLAVGYNLGGDGTGTGPFDHYLAETTKSVEIGTATQAQGGIHGDFTSALSLLVADGKKLTGWALDDAVEPVIWGAVDANGRPLYTELPTDDVSQAIARPGRLLNRPSYMGDGVGNGTIVGFGGNFQKAAWGAVGGISYRVSTEATVTINGALTSLWEHNLVAVLAEAEYGFVVEDVEHFVKLTEAA